MTSKSCSRTQRRRPQRLSWPTSLSQGSIASDSASSKPSKPSKKVVKVRRGYDGGSSSGNDNDNKRKRSRVSENGNNSKQHSKDVDVAFDNMVMWIKKFAPVSSLDLCMAPKKVKEIQTWIRQSYVSRSAPIQASARTKSNDNNNNNSSSSSNNNNSNNRNTYTNTNANTDDATEQKQKLLILVGSPGVGKSTAVQVIANELNLSVLSWNESFNPRARGPYPHAHAHGQLQKLDANSLFSVEQTSALDSFNEFLQQSGCGFISLNFTTSSIFNEKSIILIEDLPNLHGIDQEVKFRSIMNEHLNRSQVPTILVFSEVYEGKHRPKDLERLIDPDDLYDNDRTKILQIQGVTKPKMKKVLSNIAKNEKCRYDSNLFEEIHHQSQGDMRHAIMTLQLHAIAVRSNSNSNLSSKYGTITTLKNGQNNRDTKLSAFHSLGKLLYAKRMLGNDGQSHLAFDPEEILERSDLGVEGSLKFLEFHSPDFFTDVTELSNAYNYFSDAAFILGNNMARAGINRNESGSVFPYECASSIAGRAVANTNINRASNKFRTFTRPKSFDVIQNRKQNQALVNQLSRKVSRCQCVSPNFVTESLPFVRLISPQEVDPFLDNLYSAAMQLHKEKKGKREVYHDNEDDRILKEQESLLRIDDIDEFDNDDDT